MINEIYCSYEVSKLLKEKGFDEPCYMAYVPTNRKHMMRNDAGHSNSMHPDDYYAAPTQQMAMKWLREVHKYFVEIRYSFDGEDECGYVFKIIKTEENDIGIWSSTEEPYRSYEEAIEAAIMHCLKYLID